MTTLQQSIVTIANALVGIKEIEPNQGWLNAPEFTADMLNICQWSKGDEWCSDTGRVIWHRAGIRTSCLSSNCMETWRNFRNSPDYHTSPNIPVPGALAIWQLSENGVPAEKGHLGVVGKLSVPQFHAIEGNTSAIGTRTGNIIWENLHLIGKPYNPNSLNLVGFVYPDKIICK